MLATTAERIALQTTYPFTIARETVHEIENVIVRVADAEGREGVGGAAPSRRYGETVDTVMAVLPELLDVVTNVGDPNALQQIERGMHAVVRGHAAAKMAISAALHDLRAQQAGLPLYRFWGLDATAALTSSFTIGIDSTERMIAKTQEAVAAGYPTLKVKLGTARDREIIDAVRTHAPDATLRVDANEAWTPREALAMIEVLADYDVEFVEQPLPAEQHEALKFVYDRSVLPIALDESCVTLSDIPRIADRADIANLKLMKCATLQEAHRMVHAARAHGLEVMLGCMIESNASIAPAAHLTPLLDYCDLDGSLLLSDDPFTGVPMPAGRIALDEATDPGSGAQLR